MKTNIARVLRIVLVLVSICVSGDAWGQVGEQVVYSFGTATNDGSAPTRVMQGPDGWLYGATSYGGNDAAGTLFKVNTDGTGYLIIHNFTSNNVGDGEIPSGDIVLTNGWLYGTTVYGGASNSGTVYKINTNGTGFMLLHSFAIHASAGYGPTEYPHHVTLGSDGALYGTIEGTTGGFGGAVFKVGTDGGSYQEIQIGGFGFPRTGLVRGRDGGLYGTALTASAGKGGVYRISPDGSSVSLLFAFPTNPAAPYVSDWPSATMIQGQDGALYGTTQEGGDNFLGMIFTINTNGSGFTQLYSFTTEGSDHLSLYPNSLVQGRDGALYGTTLGGGYIGLGTAFRMNTDGTGYNVLWRFAAGNNLDGEQPDSGLILGRDGSFYGVTQAGTLNSGTVFKLTLPSPAIALLDTFGANASDGASPESALVQGMDGTLYGTTGFGGNANGHSGAGTVFDLNPAGLGYNTLYRFSADGSTGEQPSGIVLGSDGGLYGGAGGGSNQAGVVYRVNTDGTGYTLLHTFTTNSNDGRFPSGAPIQGQDGALYGATTFGGKTFFTATHAPEPGLGTVYTVQTNGLNYKVLFRFGTNSMDGAFPNGALLQATDGLLYGTAMGGSNGQGCIYKLDVNSLNYSVIYNFGESLNDGAEPNSLIQGRDGALYGTAEFGGSDGVGVVFRVDTNGLGYMLLHNFSTNNNDAAWPAGITQGSDGKLYGTSQYGGTGNAGTVYYGPTGLGTIFDLNTNGAHYAVIYSFTGTEGQNPPAPPIQGLDGALYGTLSSGGTNSSGTVFRFALTPAEFSSPVVLSNGSFKFSVNGGALNYGIDASTDMINWVRLTNVLNTVGTIKFTDSTAASSPQRFFRAVWSLY